MDALEQYLRSDSGHTCVGADQLGALGWKAAGQFMQESIPLNTSVARLAKEASLNDEQTRRVLEHANNAAFAMMFRAGFTQNITFPLADPAQILQKSEAPVKTTKQAAANPPGERYVPGQEFVSLENAFEAELHKTASSDTPDLCAIKKQWLDRTAQICSLRADHQTTADQFVIELSGLDVLIKQARADGNHAYEVGACVASAKPNANLARFLLERYGELADITCGLAKVAEEGGSVVPNPVTDAVQKLEALQQQLMATQEAVSAAQQQVDQMLQTMRAPINENPADQLFRTTPPSPADVPPAPPAQPAPDAAVQPVVM